MSESKDTMTNGKNISQKDFILNELSKTKIIIFKILLIIHIIINFFTLIFFGLNQIVLFVVSTTIIIRMYIGIKNGKPNYFTKGLFLFIMCFVCHVIKIIFRFTLTYFIFKNREDISNLKDMNIIETNTILWIKNFDIKLNGMWSLIIIIIFMIYWIILIIIFELNKKYFNYNDIEEKNNYLSLINNYYLQQNNNQVDAVVVNNNNNNNNIDLNS